MKIKDIEIFLDGGTVKIETDKGIFCVDSRLFTTTKGKLFHGYPRHDNKNIVNKDLDSIIKDIIECLTKHTSNNKDYIIQLIKENN